MFDRYQREIHYLRLSVTDLCNLRCRYCMPDGVEKLEREAVLTYEEFLRLAALFAQCGIDTVRVTGGEPLVRKNVAQLVAGLKATPGIRRVTLTTNAVLLAEQLSALLDAGLDSVNISLDSPTPGGVPADHRPGRFCRRAGGLAGGAGKRPARQAELCAAGGHQRGRTGTARCTGKGQRPAGAVH